MTPNQLPLKDIHLPESVGWWPPAIGWWILAFLIPLLIVLGIWLFKRITRKTALKTAKAILNSIKQDENLDDYQKVCQMSVLIRRTAISCFPRSETASLTGKEWLLFLDTPLQDQRFSDGIGKLLVDAPYQQQIKDNSKINALFGLCEDWLQALTKQKHD